MGRSRSLARLAALLRARPCAGSGTSASIAPRAFLCSAPTEASIAGTIVLHNLDRTSIEDGKIHAVQTLLDKTMGGFDGVVVHECSLLTRVILIRSVNP